MIRSLCVFATVLIMGAILRFVPNSNWVWWADLAWIAWIALCVAVLVKGPRR